LKRVLACADPHCGHKAGLTPPQYQFPARSSSSRKVKQWGQVQSELWAHWKQHVERLKPIDVLLIGGDAIDGKGSRSGGTELLTADLHEQSEMAVECFNWIEAEKVIMVYGTPYHVNGADGTDYEGFVARELGATIGGHEWVDVNGCVFDLKHKIGGSQVPHGRHTAIARERLWNVLWNERDYAPKADVILRAHVHYFQFCGASTWSAFTLPALQGPGSKFGIRQCSGTVDFGFVHFDVDDDGRYQWQTHVLEIRAGRPEPIKC